MKALRDYHEAQDSINGMMNKIERNIRAEGVRFPAEDRKARRARERQERKEKKKAKVPA